MKDKIFLKIEQIFFILLNLLFSASTIIAAVIIVLSMAMAFFILHHFDVSWDNQETYIWRALFIFWLVYMFFKLFLMPILFSFPKTFPFIFSFLDRFKKELLFKLKVIGSVLLLDISTFMIALIIYSSLGETTIKISQSNFPLFVIVWIIFGFGVLPSYLTFLLLKHKYWY